MKPVDIVRLALVTAAGTLALSCGSSGAANAPKSSAGSPATSSSSDSSTGSPNASSPADPAAGSTGTTTHASSPPPSASTEQSASGQETALGTLSPVSGDVTITLDDASSLASTAGTVLVSGSTVSTAAGGLAELVVQGAVVRLGSETNARMVADDPSSVTIELSHGSVWWVQRPEVTNSISVRIGGATATSSNARALASCELASCFVGAIDGTVSLFNEVGNASVLRPLQYSAVSTDTISAPTPFPPSALAALPFPAANDSMDRAAGLRPTPADAQSVVSPTTALLDGPYSVTYRTTASDREDVSDDTVVRSATAHTNCVQLACTITLSSEVKNSDGSIITLDSPMTFDGTTYRGALSSSAPCMNNRTGERADSGIAYTASIALIVTSANYAEGIATVSGFEITTDETNVVTQAGHAIDCRINLRNDPYSVHDVVVGAGERP